MTLPSLDVTTGYLSELLSEKLLELLELLFATKTASQTDFTFNLITVGHKEPGATCSPAECTPVRVKRADCSNEGSHPEPALRTGWRISITLLYSKV